MSEKTRQEVLEKKRRRYTRAGKEHKTKIINEVVELVGYHRKAAPARSGVCSTIRNSTSVIE